MKKSVLIVFIIFPFILFSQTFKLKLGNEFSGTYSVNPKGLYRLSDSSFAYIGSSLMVNKELVNMNIVGQNLHTNDRIKIYAPFEDAFAGPFFEIKGKIYWLTLKKNKKDRKLERYILELNKKGDIEVMKQIGSLEYNDYDDFPLEEIYFSPDSNKILIIDIFDKDKKKVDNKFNLTTLDAEFNVLNSIIFNFNISQKLVDGEYIIISNEGYIYMLSKTYNSNKINEYNSKTKLPDYKRTLTMIYPDGTHKSKDLNLDKMTLNGVLLSNKIGDVFVVLPYIEEKSYMPEGLFIKKFRKNSLEIVNDTKRAFTSNEIEKFGKWDKTEKKYIYFYGFNKEILLNDTSFNCSMFKSYYKTERNQNGSVTSRYNTDGFNFNISNDGNLISVIFIPKFHTEGVISSNGNTFVLNNGIKTFFLYNDFSSNLKKDISEYSKFNAPLFNKVLPVVSYINDKGKLIRKEINPGKGYLLVPAMTKKISDNEYLLLFSDSSLLNYNYKFGLLTIQP